MLLLITRSRCNGELAYGVLIQNYCSIIASFLYALLNDVGFTRHRALALSYFTKEVDSFAGFSPESVFMGGKCVSGIYLRHAASCSFQQCYLICCACLLLVQVTELFNLTLVRFETRVKKL